MKKPAIPQVPKLVEPRTRFDASIKETLEILTGLRGSEVKPLATTATTDDIIAKINELLRVLQ